MQKLLLLGDEAIAQGAIDGGIWDFMPIQAHHLLKLWNMHKNQKKLLKKGYIANGLPMKKQQWRLPLECLILVKEQWYK